jgi:hypothetical protein
MNLLKRFGIAIALLLAMIIGVAYVIPNELNVARSIEINSGEGNIFPYLNSPRKFNQWSPWAARDPNAEYVFTGPDSGEGATMAWKSKQTGTGTLQVVQSQKNKFIEIALDFGQHGQATSYYKLERVRAGTRVTWGFISEAGFNPISRWMGLLMSRWIGQDYAKGLKRLKSLVEDGRVSNL